MTTICATKKIMAGDSGVGYGPIVIRGRKVTTSKVWRQNGSVWGAAGTTASQLEFKSWLDMFDKSEELIEMFRSHLHGDSNSPSSFTAIQLDPKGQIWMWMDAVPPTPIEDFESIGSGHPLATILVMQGFDPRYVIREVAKLEPYTAPPVTFERLELGWKEEFTQQYLRAWSRWVKVSDYTEMVVDVSPKQFKGVPIDRS